MNQDPESNNMFVYIYSCHYNNRYVKTMSLGNGNSNADTPCVGAVASLPRFFTGYHLEPAEGIPEVRLIEIRENTSFFALLLQNLSSVTGYG